MFPGLPRFLRSSASMYYTEHKSKNKKRGRPGNEANYTLYTIIQKEHTNVILHVYGSHQTLFHCTFQSCHHVRSAVVQNFCLGGAHTCCIDAQTPDKSTQVRMSPTLSTSSVLQGFKPNNTINLGKG